MPVKKTKKVSPKGGKTKKQLRNKPVKKNVNKIIKIKKKNIKSIGAGKVKKKSKEGNIVGIITHYFPKVRAAVVKLGKPLAIGDMIKIKGHTTDFTQQVNSMQIDRVPVNAVKKGDEIGLLVESRVRPQDIVYKV